MTGAVRERSQWQPASGWRGLFRDRPILPLLVLLVILIVLNELARPGIVRPGWVGVIVRTAVPLAILAGCQTLTLSPRSTDTISAAW